MNTLFPISPKFNSILMVTAVGIAIGGVLQSSFSHIDDYKKIITAAPNNANSYYDRAEAKSNIGDS